MQDNPFSPHAPASAAVFVGRQREVDLIFGHIRAVQRGNVAIHGPLGSGKTSLLRYVSDPRVAAAHGIAERRFAFLYVDVHSVSPFSPVHFWRRTVRLLSRLGGAASLLEAPIQALLDRETIDVADVEEFLDAVAENDMVVVLLLDEFEWALQVDTAAAEAESRDFLAQLASLARRAPRVLSLIVASEAPLVEAVRVITSWRGSPFPTVFTSLALRPLERTDSDRLVDLALAGRAVSLTEEDRSLLYRLAGGQPAALQAAAFTLFHGSQSGTSGERLWEIARHAAVSTLDLQPASAPPPDRPAPPSVTVPPAADGAGSGLWIDPGTGDVVVGGRHLESLTALEFNLLRLLSDRPGRLCSKEEIIRHVWGDALTDEVDESRVEKLISRLRRKIETVPSRPQYIRTVRGRGYRFVP